MNPTTQPPDTLGALLDAGRERLREHSESARLDAELLLTRVTGASRAVIYANPDKEIGPSEIVAYRQLLEARAAGQPVAYLTGEREFWSLSFEVNEHTLIPRPETEYLVEAALKRLQADKPADVIELGTGSGAIAAALATERSGWNITATDVDPQTLAVAARNLRRHGCERVALIESDWFAAVPTKAYDLIISNPPYVSTSQRELTDAAIAFEPRHALFSGADGLDAIRVIIGAATAYLKPAGWLMLEHGFDQAKAVADLLARQRFTKISLTRDLHDQPRVTTAQAPE